MNQTGMVFEQIVGDSPGVHLGGSFLLVAFQSEDLQTTEAKLAYADQPPGHLGRLLLERAYLLEHFDTSIAT